jgi:hypothetical protein
MKYIVWDLISPCDGYGTTECDTWEQVCEVMKRSCTPDEYKKWAKGKTPKVEVPGHKEIFVTTTPLTVPIP